MDGLKGYGRIIAAALAFVVAALMLTNIKIIYLDCVFKALLPAYSIAEYDSEKYNLKAQIDVNGEGTYIAAKLKLNDTTKAITKFILKSNYDENQNTIEYFADFEDWWKANESQVTDSYIHYTDKKINKISNGTVTKTKVPFCSCIYIVDEIDGTYMYLVNFV